MCGKCVIVNLVVYLVFLCITQCLLKLSFKKKWIKTIFLKLQINTPAIYPLYIRLPMTTNFYFEIVHRMLLSADRTSSSRIPLSWIHLQIFSNSFKQAEHISCGGNTDINEMSAKPTCLIVASAAPQGESISCDQLYIIMRGMDDTVMKCSIYCTHTSVYLIVT